jgi:hypothetical protein
VVHGIKRFDFHCILLHDREGNTEEYSGSIGPTTER